MNDQRGEGIAPQDIRKLVESCLEDVLDERGSEDAVVIGPTTRLVGRGSVLDSLALVTLIVDVEDRLLAEYGVSVTLANDRAVSQARSPFLTVDTLAQYVVDLLADAH